MASESDRLIVHRLFVAVPDAFFDKHFTRYLRRKGLIDDNALRSLGQMQRDTKRIAAVSGRMKGQSFFQRLLTIAPELITRRSVGWFEDTGFITKHDANALRLLLRTAKIAEGGLPTSWQEVFRRARYLMSSAYMDDAMELMITAEFLDKRSAQQIKGLVLGGEITVETLQKVLRAKTFVDFLQLAGSGLVSPKVVRALRIAGLLDNRTANALLSAMSYGSSLWTVFEGSRKAEGLAARMAYVASGSISWELVDFVNSLVPVSKKIKPYQVQLLKVAVQVSQRYNRQMMEQMTDRKFRVIPGESPIVTYFRASKETDGQILGILAEAAEDAKRRAQALSGVPRGAEYALRADALHQAMRRVWEGTGFLTIHGEEQVANAAVEASEFLNAKYSKHADPFIAQMLQYQARSGLDSYISRKENTLPLARRVYGNINLWTGKVDREISKGLLVGDSAQEIANRVQKLINPSVMGGVKYAALRLGRTELSNAFHLSTIRHSREMPWVKGYKWNKSSSHRHGDICDEYAENDTDNMGPGVFKKTNVPDKPHPQCMCYITVVGVDEADFVKAYNAGRYNQYLNSRVAEAGVADAVFNRIASDIAANAGRVAGTLAWSRGAPALANMITGSQKGNKGFNPVSLNSEVVALKNANKGKRLRELTDKITNIPTVSAMIDDVNAGHKELDLPELTAAQKKKMTRAVADFEGKLKGADGQLLKRKNAFLDLERTERAYTARHLAAKKQHHANLTLESPPMSALARYDFDELSYREMLDPDSSVRYRDQDVISVGLYGSASYRKMNYAMRKHGGDMKGVGKEFKDFDTLFEELDDTDFVEGDEYQLWDVISGWGERHGIRVADTVEPEGDETDDEMFLGAVYNVMSDWPANKKFSMGGLRSMGDVITNIDQRMEPSKGDRFTYRITGPDFYGLNGKMPSQKDIGHVFSDDAYISTEGVKGYFRGVMGEENLGLSLAKRPTRIKMFVPNGTMMTRVNDSEYELLLSRGTKFQILDVINEDQKETGFLRTVHLAVIGQDDTIHHRAKKADEEDMWDAIMGDF